MKDRMENNEATLINVREVDTSKNISSGAELKRTESLQTDAVLAWLRVPGNQERLAQALGFRPDSVNGKTAGEIVAREVLKTPTTDDRAAGIFEAVAPGSKDITKPDLAESLSVRADLAKVFGEEQLDAIINSMSTMDVRGPVLNHLLLRMYQLHKLTENGHSERRPVSETQMWEQMEELKQAVIALTGSNPDVQVVLNSLARETAGIKYLQSHPGVCPQVGDPHDIFHPYAAEAVPYTREAYLDKQEKHLKIMASNLRQWGESQKEKKT